MSLLILNIIWYCCLKLGILRCCWGEHIFVTAEGGYCRNEPMLLSGVGKWKFECTIQNITWNQINQTVQRQSFFPEKMQNFKIPAKVMFAHRFHFAFKKSLTSLDTGFSELKSFVKWKKRPVHDWRSECKVGHQVNVGLQNCHAGTEYLQVLT